MVPFDVGSVRVVVGTAYTLVILEGEIDAQLAPMLDDAVQQAQLAGLPVRVDACGVTFVDSTGITALARLAVHTPGQLVLEGAPEALEFLLHVTSLADMIDVRRGHEPSRS